MAVIERDDVGKVEHSHNMSTSVYKFAATAESFEIWSDGLYSHKVRAVIRETSTNAQDAYIQRLRNDGYSLEDIMSGNVPVNDQIPFEVHLPDKFNLVYKIRDFGIGLGASVKPMLANGQVDDTAEPRFEGSINECLSYLDSLDPSEASGLCVEDDVQSMYTTYFLSDKVHSNDFTGCLGLGSKSPFAYSPTFTVVNIHKGEKRIYTAYISDGSDDTPEGFPCMSLVSGEGAVEPTNEADGLEIIIPVKNEDIWEFNKEAQNIYKYFRLTPKINIDIPKLEYSIKGEGWGLRSEAGSARAIMGSIAYPIESFADDLDEDILSLINAPIDIEFSIGSLRHAPSREALSYKKQTKQILINRLADIVDEIREVVAKEFDTCDCLWDARLKAKEYIYGTDSGVRQLSNIIAIKNIKFNGGPIGTGSINMSDFVGEKDWTGKTTTEPLGELMMFSRKYRKTRYSRTGYETAYGVRNTVNKIDSVSSVNVEKGAEFYEIDIPRGAYSRLHCQVKDGQKDPVYAARFKNAAAKKKFCELLGIPASRIKKVSSLPKPPSVIGNRYSNSGQVFIHSGVNYKLSKFYSYWNDGSNVNLEDGGIYVEINRYQVRNRDNPDLTEDPYKVGRIIQCLKKLGYNIEVVGVRSGLAKKFKKSDDWVDIWTYAENVLDILMSKNDFETHLSNVKEIQDFNYSKLLSKVFTEWITRSNIDVPPGPFQDLILDFSEIDKSHDYVDNSRAVDEIAGYIGYKIDFNSPSINLEERFNKMLDRYPMIKYTLDSSWTNWFKKNNRQWDDIEKYIALVDSDIE